MPQNCQADVLPEPIVVDCAAGRDELLTREWLIANRLGAYASSTVLGCNTRRYHGLLVAATSPPAGRIVALNCLKETFSPSAPGGGEEAFDLSTFEFVGAFVPDAAGNLVEFSDGPAASFRYRCGQAELIKEILLADSANAVAVRYRLLAGPPGVLRIRPFLALRDYHALRRRSGQSGLTYLHYHHGVRVEDREGAVGAVHVSVSAGGAEPKAARFEPSAQWWYRFRYRADLARGQEGLEDLYTPGFFQIELTAEAPVQLTASLDDARDVHFDATLGRRRRRMAAAARAVGPDADALTRRLAVAADAFIVRWYAWINSSYAR